MTERELELERQFLQRDITITQLQETITRLQFLVFSMQQYSDKPIQPVDYKINITCN